MAAALLAVCCVKADPEVTPDEPDEPEVVDDDYEATINFSNGTSFDLGGDKDSEVLVRFSVDHEWTLKSVDKQEQTWLEPSKTSGNSSKAVKLTFKATEDNGYEERTAKFKIYSGASSKKFTITQSGKCLVLTADDVPEMARYYKPQEFDFDMLRSDSKWSWVRSKHTEHVVVFWDKQYGEYGLYGSELGIEDTWPTTAKSSSMKVDIDDLLQKAEEYYEMNVNTLKFCDVGEGKSVLDDYMFEIYILYQSEWLATGSGYDNSVGALWVNPSTCQPVGSTIAHEIGHAFQYMTFCDWLKGKGITGSAALNASGLQGPGWRYGFGNKGDGGCAWWEQCAQWQSFQTFSKAHDYKAEAFSSYYSSEFFSSTRLHIIHPRPRYANYFIQWWWCQQNDISFIGKLWRNAEYPEDPCETYMRLMGYDTAQFNDSMWEYAAHCMTFDFDEVRSYGKNYIGKTAISANNLKEDGEYWRITDQYAPETTGSNAFLMTSAAGKTVTADFKGLFSMTGSKYIAGSATLAGWRYGFVSYNSDGSTTYSDIFSDNEGTATFDVPSDSKKLWFVVSGAPKNYERKSWVDSNEEDTQDNKWPWEAKFTGTKPNGK